MNEYFINRFRTLVLVRETIRFPVRSKSYKEQFSKQFTHVHNIVCCNSYRNCYHQVLKDVEFNTYSDEVQNQQILRIEKKTFEQQAYDQLDFDK